MKFKYIFILGIFLLNRDILYSQSNKSNIECTNIDTFKWYDSVRSRSIPIAIYCMKSSTDSSKKNIIIISHGYAENHPRAYLSYSYLADFLSKKGYFVLSIQHEIPTDSLMPKEGIPQIVRRPFWDRGADNIHFVIGELKNKYKNLDFDSITLIGHSNGGDMTVLFPAKYPQLVYSIITLDHRRMKLPLNKNLRILSLRSSDQLPDEGVLPSEKECLEYGIQIIYLKNTTHNDMGDYANDIQRKEIQDIIIHFLGDR